MSRYSEYQSSFLRRREPRIPGLQSRVYDQEWNEMEQNGTKLKVSPLLTAPEQPPTLPIPSPREHLATRSHWPHSRPRARSEPGPNRAKSGHGRGCLHSWPLLKNCARQRWDSDGERAKLTRGRGGDMFRLSIPLSRGCGIGCLESPETRFSALPVRPGRAG